MTLEELRAGTLEWLDDPNGDQFVAGDNHARIDRYVNEAYQKVVNEVDRVPRPYGVEYAAGAVEITPVDPKREYPIGMVRRVVDVFEISGEDELDVDIVTWSERNRVSTGVYIFRSPDQGSATYGSFPGGSWALGLVSLPPAYSKLRVYTLPVLTKLADAQDVPVAVPEDFHELIYYRAAMLGKMSVRRALDELAGLYAEGIADLRAKLSQAMARTMQAPRLMRHRRRAL